MRSCCAAPRRGDKRSRRPAAPPENLSLSPVVASVTQQKVEKAISPSVRGSPVVPSDDTDSPRNRCSSEPLGVEHLRARTGRAASMFCDIRSPARSQLLPTSPLSQRRQAEEARVAVVAAAAEEEDNLETYVEIVVPSLPDDLRLVNVLLDDGSQVEVDVPAEVRTGETYVVNVAEVLRRQRRQKFLEDDATRAELLQEIEFLSWSLSATVAAARIQAFVRRRQCGWAMKQNAAALMGLIREARTAQGS